MSERGLLPAFSAAVVAQTDAIKTAAIETGSTIRDLRKLLWCSIDNDDSRDLDQLSIAQPLSNERTKILVAIADVDALVAKGSAIDDHARTNTTSVYTAAGIFPMLPEKLSTDLTSLAEGEERMAVVVDMSVDANGVVVESDVYRALVVNHAKLAYNGVAAWLEGQGPPPQRLAAVQGLGELLRIQDRVAQSMKRVRHERGALSLETPDPRAVFDGEVLVDLRPDETNRAKQLIEDFMIAANSATVACLRRAGLPSLRRVLRSPKRWGRIVELAAGLGEPLPSEPEARALEEFLAKRLRADPTGFPDLSLSIVKLLGSGEYEAEFPGHESEGHFGLAVMDYAHSTAPNRRFPDLVTQRLVKAALARRAAPYSHDELIALARHCTEQEDNAAKVERQIAKSAAALLLESRVGERFDAIVTGASEKGTWVRILRPACEGKVVRGSEGLDVGERVRVKLVHTDVEHGYIDFVH